jgi:hypothetical protein
MAILLALILFLHVVGALIFIPSMVSLFKPRFAMTGGAAEGMRPVPSRFLWPKTKTHN